MLFHCPLLDLEVTRRGVHISVEATRSELIGIRAR